MGENKDNTLDPEITRRKHRVVDIGVNLTEDSFKDSWREVIQRAVDSGVYRIVLTGLTIKESLQSLIMVEQWFEETACPNLYATVGVHPYNASTWWNSHDDGGVPEESSRQMRELLRHPLPVAAGECGLDYNRFDSCKEDQIKAFREQVVELACELDMPLFLHEREAHDDFISILDEDIISILDAVSMTHDLPPIVVHCFTGTLEEATAYVKRGFSISSAGTICSKSRGKRLRKLLPTIPAERLMVKTDAPYTGFTKERRSSEPADCVDVARKMGETVKVSFEEVCHLTTRNAMDFFRIPN
jgi:TatD DNase family protein